MIIIIMIIIIIIIYIYSLYLILSIITGKKSKESREWFQTTLKSIKDERENILGIVIVFHTTNESGGLS